MRNSSLVGSGASDKYVASGVLSLANFSKVSLYSVRNKTTSTSSDCNIRL